MPENASPLIGNVCGFFFFFFLSKVNCIKQNKTLSKAQALHFGEPERIRQLEEQLEVIESFVRERVSIALNLNKKQNTLKIINDLIMI